MKNECINVLIACECSQVEAKAFRRLGFTAYSCDLQTSYGGHPEWHIVGDVLPLLQGRSLFFHTEDGLERWVYRWHIIIAHPPCTYLCQVGAAPRAYSDTPVAMHYRTLMADAAEFFRACLAADAPFVAVENPRPSPLAGLPRHSWICYPNKFGSRWTKRTHWWLRNLPPLLPMQGENFTRSSAASNRRGQKRSESFVEVAEAMASQWGGLVKSSMEKGGRHV